MIIASAIPFVSSAATTDANALLDVIRKINKDVNFSVEYKSDLQNYGKDDFWEAAWKSGDCEDIAIAKLHKCREYGISIDILMLSTCITESGENHVVLLAKIDDFFYVLDNRSNEVTKHSEIAGYKFESRQSIGGSKTWVQFS